MEEQKTEDEINILEYLIALAKHKKLIITITMSIAIVTAIISLIMTPVYRAQTTIVPPKQSSSFMTSLILKKFGGLGEIAGGALGIRDTKNLYIGMTESRTVMDRVIDRFKLMEAYDAEFKEDAREELGGVVKVRYSEITSFLTISVENEDPKIAADMANAFVDELRNLLKHISVTEASQRRTFFDEQLKQATENLIKSEEALKEFQERTGILNPGSLMPAIRIPAVATEFIRKMRDLKYNEKLFEIMAEQYELAKIDEAKDPTIIQVIDRAIPPQIKARPQRKLMVVIAAFMGFLFSLVLVLIKDYLEKQPESDKNRERVNTLKKLLSFKKEM